MSPLPLPKFSTSTMFLERRNEERWTKPQVNFKSSAVYDVNHCVTCAHEPTRIYIYIYTFTSSCAGHKCHFSLWFWTFGLSYCSFDLIKTRSERLNIYIYIYYIHIAWTGSKHNRNYIHPFEFSGAKGAKTRCRNINTQTKQGQRPLCWSNPGKIGNRLCYTHLHLHVQTGIGIGSPPQMLMLTHIYIYI